MRWKKLIAAAIAVSSLTVASGGMFEEKVSAEVIKIEQENIVSVTGIGEVFGDGEKISAAIIEYPQNINPKSVSIRDFKVADKKIEAVYVNDEPSLTDKNKIGRFVILKFAYENTAFDGSLENRPRPNDNPRAGDAPKHSNRQLPDLNFSVKQVGSIRAVDGTKFLPSEKTFASTSTLEPVIDSFQQFIYTDPVSGNSMPYNLYLPRDYDSAKKYPLLFFVADASANINEIKTPLFQGNGATSFAQDKYDCIILAPQYTADLVDKLGMMTTDENIWTDGLELTKNLLFDVINNYAVDKNRIYGTGQSQGGMANIAISDRYPDIFAAQLLVACQWNVEEMSALKDKNLWIVVCEGDTKAFPGMNAAVANWKNLGARVATNTNFWDSKASIADLNKKVRQIERQRANINYTVFAGGNHMYTWSFAYNISALREWIFKQKLRRN